MKKAIVKFIPVRAVLLSLTACGGKEEAKQNPYYPENDIITVEDLNDDRMINTRTVWVKNDNSSYWVPSNLKIEYAPLLPENSIISVKNMDGSEFDLEKTYKVAIWNGCFSNLSETSYFDQATLAAMEDVTPVSDIPSADYIKAAVIEAGEIEPPKDGRFTIRWDIRPQAE